jgi:hypothetical protein
MWIDPLINGNTAEPCRRQRINCAGSFTALDFWLQMTGYLMA